VTRAADELGESSAQSWRRCKAVGWPRHPMWSQDAHHVEVRVQEGPPMCAVHAEQYWRVETWVNQLIAAQAGSLAKWRL
jgi:hypothetical protein